MRAKLLVITNVIFVILFIAFAFFWNKIFDGGPREQKGDYLVFCLKVSIILAFLYAVGVKLILQKLFPVALLLIIPVTSCIASVIMALGISILIGDTSDVSILQLFLFIHCATVFGLVYLFGYVAKKKQTST